MDFNVAVKHYTELMLYQINVINAREDYEQGKITIDELMKIVLNKEGD